MTFHYPHLARRSQNSQTSEGQVSPPTHTFSAKPVRAPVVTSQRTHMNRQIIAFTDTTCHCDSTRPDGNRRAKSRKTSTSSKEMQIARHRDQLCEHYAPPRQPDPCDSRT